MGNDYKLTIGVITMNRSDQLIEALDSCLNCKLPEKTEFVLLDNGSEDGTAQAVAAYQQSHPQVQIRYHYSKTNLGIGGGRSFVFEKALGEYVYFLDDDAIIAPQSKDSFFVESLQYLDRNPRVASLTTQIIDEGQDFGRNELAVESHTVDGLPMMFFYLGGSHFLRKTHFEQPLYFSIRYGSEEYMPSIKAMDKGYCHVYCGSISIIHKPKVNKWVDGSDHMRRILISGAAVTYATKKLLYPVIFHPVLWAGYLRRCDMYLKAYHGAKKEADAMARQIIRENPCKKVRISTVLNMYRIFGMTVF